MPETNAEEFRNLLKAAWPELAIVRQELAVRFYRLVLAENEQQNLTRLISPKDFLEGHVLDVRALLKSGLVGFPALDLGSGVGVPGLLAAAMCDDSWILAESEGRKAAFLESAAESLELFNVEVFSGRGEDYLKTRDVSTVVARAVGPVDRIYAWLRPCSTWNKLVLFKGPGWDAEWTSFQEGKHRHELEIEAEYNYTVGEPAKRLRIIKLGRSKVRGKK